MAAPVKRHLITTVSQAYDYAIGSEQAAADGVCPSAAGVYRNLATDVSSGVFGTNVLNKSLFMQQLEMCDGVCRAAPDYYKRTMVQPSAPVSPTGAPAPEEGPMGPDISDELRKQRAGLGLPWWLIAVLGGGALYLLLSKKGKK